MAITKQKYIIGGTLQTPTPWNRNVAFISAGTGGGVSSIISAFQSRVAAAGNETFFEATPCLTNTIQSLSNIDFVPDADTIVYRFQSRIAAAGNETFFEARTCAVNTIQSLLNINT